MSSSSTDPHPRCPTTRQNMVFTDPPQKCPKGQYTVQPLGAATSNGVGWASQWCWSSRTTPSCQNLPWKWQLHGAWRYTPNGFNGRDDCPNRNAGCRPGWMCGSQDATMCVSKYGETCTSAGRQYHTTDASGKHCYEWTTDNPPSSVQAGPCPHSIFNEQDINYKSKAPCPTNATCTKWGIGPP